MLSLLLTLLVVIVIAGSIFWILSILGLPEPWARVAKAIVALFLLIWLLSVLLPRNLLIR
jgi:hypothetical protein